MNSIKLFSLVLLMLLASCKNADNSIMSKKITKITVQSVDEVNFTYHYKVYYDDQNRITKIEPDHTEIFGITYIEYGEGTFKIGKEDLYTSCLLNDDGYISDTEEDNFIDLFPGSMKYNKKGQLESIQFSEAQEILFKWKDGNMEESNFENQKTVFTYTNLENKNNFSFLLRIDGENCSPVFPYFELLGKPTRHLVASVEQSGDGVKYEYKTDADGFVEELTMVYSANGIENISTVKYNFLYELVK